MRRSVFLLTLAVALVLGGALAWIDSRPTWDDTGITAGVLLLGCACFGIARPRFAWLWALSIGAWIPLVEIVTAGDYGSLLALIVAFAGAYAGAAVHKLVQRRSELLQ